MSELTLDEWAADVANASGVTEGEDHDAALKCALAAALLKHGAPDRWGLPYFVLVGHMMRSLESLEKTLNMAGKIGGGP